MEKFSQDSTNTVILTETIEEMTMEEFDEKAKNWEQRMLNELKNMEQLLEELKDMVDRQNMKLINMSMKLSIQQDVANKKEYQYNEFKKKFHTLKKDTINMFNNL